MERLTSLFERLSARRWFVPALCVALVAAIVVVGAGGSAISSSLPPAQTARPVAYALPPDIGRGLDPNIGRLLDPQNPANASKFSFVFLRLFAAYQTGGQSAVEQEARSIGLLDDEGMHAELTLTKPFDDEIAGRFREAGLRIDGFYGNKVTVTFPMARLLEVQAGGDTSFVQRLIRFEEITNIAPPSRVTTGDADLPELQPLGVNYAFGDRPLEGVKRTGADTWHAANLKGRNVKVGIVDFFTNYDKLVGGLLPADLVARDFSGQGFNSQKSEHGVSTAQIIHEMAPEAKLYLAGVSGNTLHSLNALDWLISERVDVINISMGNVGVPWDGNGPISRKIDEAFAKGIFVSVSAGNSGGSSYLGRSKPNPIAGSQSQIQDLASIGEASPLPIVIGQGFSGGALFLMWQPGETMLRAVWFDMTDPKNPKRIAENRRTKLTEDPVLVLDIPAIKTTSVHVFVEHISGPPTPIRIIKAGGSVGIAAAYRSASGSISEGSVAKGAVAVAAAEVSTDRLTTYSSWGPTLDGRFKPEIAAPSHVGTVYHKSSPEGFNGTSAASPHVAGAAALVKGRFPAYLAPQLRQFLLDNAQALQVDTMTGVTASGFGRLALPNPSTLR